MVKITLNEWLFMIDIEWAILLLNLSLLYLGSVWWLCTHIAYNVIELYWQILKYLTTMVYLSGQLYNSELFAIIFVITVIKLKGFFLTTSQ